MAEYYIGPDIANIGMSEQTVGDLNAGILGAVLKPTLRVIHRYVCSKTGVVDRKGVSQHCQGSPALARCCAAVRHTRRESQTVAQAMTHEM